MLLGRQKEDPSILIQKIRTAILDEFYEPAERLMEADVAARFTVSRAPVREALQALKSEGTLFAAPYAGALVRPLSAAEIREIAEIRLALIAIAVRPAHRHLAPADFDFAYALAKRITQTKSATEAFECTRRFWEIIFTKAERRILSKMLRKLDDRMTRYYPVLLQLYPTPESRPRQHEVLIEISRKGKIDEAVRAFKKIYLEMVDHVVNHLEAESLAESAD